MIVVLHFLLWVILVYRVKLHPSLTTPVYGILKELPFPYAPQYQLMLLFDKHPQRLCGERYLLAYFRIFMLYYCPVKVYCYYHINYYDICLFLL